MNVKLMMMMMMITRDSLPTGTGGTAVEERTPEPSAMRRLEMIRKITVI